MLCKLIFVTLRGILYRSIEKVFRQELENALNQLFVIEPDTFLTMTSMILSVIIPITHEMDPIQEFFIPIYKSSILY